MEKHKLIRRIRAISFLNFAPILLVLVLLLPGAVVHAQSNTGSASKRILGGSHVPDLPLSQVALILTPESSCSGILVGSREVLTAAHCLAPSIYEGLVAVAGDVYEIIDAYDHSRYIQTESSVASRSNSRFDLGVLILDRSVPVLSPLKIIIDAPTQVGEEIGLFGYGRHESSSTDEHPFDAAKGGSMVVSEVVDGLIIANHYPTNSSVCSGDSGGPALRFIGKYVGLTGIASFSTNKIENGNCVLGGDGVGGFVDLQSEYSQGFLSGFPGLNFISGPLMLFTTGAEEALGELELATSSRNLSILKSHSRLALQKLKAIRPHANAVRIPVLNQAIRKLKLLRTSEKSKISKRLVTGARDSVLALVELGVS